MMKNTFTLLLLVVCLLGSISHIQAQSTKIINTSTGLVIETSNEPMNKAGCPTGVSWSLVTTTVCAGTGPIFTDKSEYSIIKLTILLLCNNILPAFEISDGAGNFANYTTLSSAITVEQLTNEGPTFRLPANLPFGTNYYFRFRHLATGDVTVSLGPLTILPVSPITLTSDQSCYKPGTTLTVTDINAASYQFSPQVSQPGGPTSTTGIATSSGTYSVTVTNPPSCTHTELYASFSLSSCSPASVLSYTATVPLNSPSTTISAFVQGTSFVLTGPKGYVFSAVYRIPGQYMFYAPDIKQPGKYLLTVYDDAGGMQQVTITVTG